MYVNQIKIRTVYIATTSYGPSPKGPPGTSSNRIVCLSV